MNLCGEVCAGIVMPNRRKSGQGSGVRGSGVKIKTEQMPDCCIVCGIELVDIDYPDKCCDCWEKWYVRKKTAEEKRAEEQALREIEELNDSDDTAA